ncbi:SMP-30/gluconolactonase/LRE family protein [Nocardia coubleae]|uniref:Superoxide dismutase n=1 Tax=Nocardia coubleae TaxID=356147 RepID=A0A846W3D4_9NOCA|nr:superoxide dismutase [Nocardia coubleae]NKX87722.1 superoxide dismutase [Nocardia coubleae]
MIRTLAMAATCLALTACGTDDPAPSPVLSTAYGLPGAAVYPEGIALDPRTGTSYVGSYADGTVFRAGADAATAEVFLPAGADGRKTTNGLRVDRDGRLWVIDSTAGVMVYDTGSRALLARFDVPDDRPRFVNDLAFGADGSAYLTDSIRNVVYRATLANATEGRGELTVAADLAPVLGPRDPKTFELNGIVADEAGTYLLVVAMSAGELYRIDLTGAEPIREVTLTGGTVRNGDGLELRGDTLWVVHNTDNTISRWTVTDRGGAATREREFHDPALSIPTTMVHSGDRALIVSSQFDKGGPMGNDEKPGPFVVSAIDGF